MLASELKSKINKLWDRFWSGGIANPLTAIEQMSYLIFMKRLEDLDNVEAKRAAARKQKHKSVFEGKEECRWSEWKHYNAPQMMEHVKNKVFPFIKNIRDGEKTLFSYHMQDAVFLIPKASLLQEAVAIIDELNITSQNIDTQGDMYEYLLSELKTAGKNGQFRTPRHIIRMIVSLVNPDIGDKICDPACGTAGFLINAYEHILKKYTSPDILKVDETGESHNLVGDKITEKKHWKILWEDTFIGYDFDTTMVRISLMNMILHGIKLPKIDYMDTLSKRYEEREKYDVILANPPFKGSIDKNDINDNLTIKTTKTELLFVEQMINLLVIGGKCGVIVPEGVLYGNTNAHKNLKKMLLETCQLDAVVAMPSGVFRPYAGVATAVLIFTKGGKTEKVWFYKMETDGYSLDDKRTYIDGKGDVPDIIEWFSKRFKENSEDRKSNCFFVPYSEIKANDYALSVSKYQDFEYDEIKYDPPNKILDRIAKNEEIIVKNLKEIRRLL